VAVGILLAFSVTVSLLGATGPMPRHGFGARGDGSERYTVAGAARNLAHGAQPDAEAPPAALADRYRPANATTPAPAGPAVGSARSEN
jgi:hypothetical protein